MRQKNCRSGDTQLLRMRGLLNPDVRPSAFILLLVCERGGGSLQDKPWLSYWPREQICLRPGRSDAVSSPLSRKKVPLLMGRGSSLSWAGTHLPWEPGARNSKAAGREPAGFVWAPTAPLI